MRGIEWLGTPLIACLVALLALAPAAAGQGDPGPDPVGLDGDGPWVVRVRTVDREVIRDLAQWFDVWSVHPEKGFILVQVDRGDVDRLVSDGFAVEVDPRRTVRLQDVLGRARVEPGPRLEERAQTSGIPGFPCYRTVEETFASAEALATAHPDLATWTDVGDSWEKTQSPTAGYDMKVLRLTQSAVPGPKPALFLSCAIHAREYATAELCTRFAELLVDDYDVDPDVTWLLDHHEVHMLLHTNPDGRKMAETGLSWRKNTNNDYCSNTSSRGADLNRNFDFQWGCCGGSSGFECSTTYRGPAPASEPEIQALQGYIASIFPDQRPDDLVTPAPSDATGVAIDVHAHGQLLLWSWGFDYDPAPNSTQLATLGRKLAWFNGHDPGQGTDLYVTDGSSKDFYYGTLGVAAFVYELGTEFFESCNYFAFNILEQNLASLFYAAKVARTPYMTPAGPDALDVAVPPTAVAPGDQVPVTALLDDTRYSTLDGIEPSQNIAAAELSVDLPPWEAGATPQAMSASDGLFDATVEGVEATLDTTGFAPGRYTLFVRGQDVAGNWGAVSAVFLHVIDPVTAPTLQGTVLDAGTAAPLAATVTAGDFEATTDANGVYTMRLPAGTYDVTVVATGYQSATAEGVVATDSQTTVRDFDLRPFAGVW
ncbi:MAG: M14 family zinc carboxypeptidase, partial [Acidobacteriota bacterium]